MAEETAALAPETPRDGSQARASRPTGDAAGWRALPTLGDGLARIMLALVLGLLTGLVWGIGGHEPPSGFFVAVGWALLLCAPVLVAILVSVAVERDLRDTALRYAWPVILTALIAIVALALVMALFITLLPDTFTLGIPILFSLILGFGAGFSLGAMRLWGMSGDARSIFVALGVVCLFGATLTFIVPAALAPQDNGSLGFLGCLLFIPGLPGVSLGSIAGGALRMRGEVEAYGYRSDGALSTASNATTPSKADNTAEPEPSASSRTPQEIQEHPMTADELIATLAAQRQILLDALAGLSDEQLDRKGIVGDWSIKNVLAHLTSWEQVVVRITPERLRTREYPEELRAINADEDADNARETAKREHLTPTEQLAELAQARADFTTMIRAVGDEALAREHPWPEWDPPLAEYFLKQVGDHDTEHSEAIRSGADSLRASTDQP